jgi:hypothetical protein
MLAVDELSDLRIKYGQLYLSGGFFNRKGQHPMGKYKTNREFCFKNTDQSINKIFQVKFRYNRY